MKNRMLEIGTSGSVRGEDGNILTYSAKFGPGADIEEICSVWRSGNEEEAPGMR